MLQLNPEISISNGRPGMLGTLLGTLVFSMGKDAYEEVRTYLKDKSENEANVRTFNREIKKWVDKQWNKLEPGDCIRIENNKPVPADICVLESD